MFLIITMTITLGDRNDEFDVKKFHGDVVEPDIDEEDYYDHDDNEEFNSMRFHGGLWSLKLYN